LLLIVNNLENKNYANIMFLFYLIFCSIFKSGYK
jgi:hypothetical protein